MPSQVDTLQLSRIRGTDTNSLLRLYDDLNGILSRSSSQPDRARAEKAIHRITAELRKRNARL